MSRTLATLACLAAWSAAAGDARAATVELAEQTPVDYGSGWAGIDYHAAPGEANRVVLTQVDDLTIGVTDPGAVIVAGRSCRSLGAHTAQCSVAGLGDYNGLIGANVRAGDLDDVIDSRGPGLSADGGPGDDTLQSSSLATGILNGGGGRDTLLGGTNRDTLTDGDTSGAADDDVLDGREGGAIVSYASRTAPVRVDLADPGPDGEPGERDTLRSVDGATGGRASDELHGDDGSNQIAGGPGDDRLVGRGGDDFVEGGPGADRVAAQAGEDFVDGQRDDDSVSGGDGSDVLDGGRDDDRLRGGDGPDVLRAGASRCGSGLDSASPARNDRVGRGCEEAAFDLRMRKGELGDSKRVVARPYPSVRGGASLVFRVQCPYLDLDGQPIPVALRGTLRIRTPGGRTLGVGRIQDAGCGRRGDIEDESRLPWVRVAVPLEAAGRGRRVIVDYSGRNVPPVPWTIDL
jgi:RTX calcium-binding nonapeptide repeat (4 copies)